MTWPDVVAAAVAKAKEVDAGALFVDTLSDWAEIKGEGENITGLAYESMAPLQRVAEAGLAVLVVRHDRKSGGEISDSARGSSAFSGVADIVLGLQRANTPGHPSRRVLKAVGRLDGIPLETVLELGEDGQYLALGDALDVERQAASNLLFEVLPSSFEDAWTEEEFIQRLNPNPPREGVGLAS